MKKINFIAILYLFNLICYGQASQMALSELESWLSTPRQTRSSVENLQYLNTPLTLEDAIKAKDLVAADYINNLKQKYSNDFNNGFVKVDEQATVKFVTKTFGNENPPGGRALIISMHGGISTDGSFNDQQWQNQQALYNNFPNDYVYIVPRSPLNVWNGWHLWQTEKAFDIIISLAIEKYNINRNKIILVGYSAGGDGVYELSPRMGDVISAGGMFAGTNNYSNPFNLNRVTWIGRIGELDSAFNRNQVMLNYADDIQDLQNKYGGYVHDVALVSGKGHWMDNAERAVFPSLFAANRDPFKSEIFWKQSGLNQYPQHTFYNLQSNSYKPNTEVIVEFNKPTSSINVIQNGYGSGELSIYVRDENVNMDNNVTLMENSTSLFNGKIDRTIKNIWETSELNEGDPDRIYYGKVTVTDPNANNINLAPDALVLTSSDFGEAYSGIKVNDQFSATSGEWASKGEQDPLVELYWNEPLVTSQIILYDRPNLSDNVNSVDITFSDGSSLTFDAVDSAGGPSVINFPEKEIEWVSLSISGSGPNVGLLELEVYGNYVSSLSVNDLDLNGTEFSVTKSTNNQWLLSVKNSSSNYKDITYSLFDMQGRVVYQSINSNGHAVIDAKNLQPGLYLATINSNGKQMCKKTIID